MIDGYSSEEEISEAESNADSGYITCNEALDPHIALAIKPAWPALPNPVTAMTSFLSFTSCSVSCDDVSEEQESEDQGELAEHEDWWEPADLSAAISCRGLSSASRLLAARVVRCPSGADPQKDPWSPAIASSLYEDLGARGKNRTYVTVWINMGEASLVFLSQATKRQAVSNCAASDDALGNRLKLIINPVQVKLPFPTKGAKDADTVGAFFGQSAWAHSLRTSSGAEVYCVRVDLYSKWLLRMAMQKVGFQLGNTVEMILVDWPGQAVLAAIRLRVTADFVKLVS